MSQLVGFYLGERGGRWTLAQVMELSDDELELHHDFIQWVFPLRERSRFNFGAPTLTDEDVVAFRASPELRDRLRQAFARFVRFLGLEYNGAEVRPIPEHPSGLELFRRPSHNWLRITRVIKSLRILGLEAEAQAFFAALKALHEQRIGITRDTFEYWREAAEGPV